LEEALKAYDDTNTVRTELARSHGVKRLTSVLRKEADRIDQTNRFNLINDMTLRSSTLLRNPLVLRPEAFFDHLKNRTYVPFPIINDLSPVQRALYFEQLSTESSFDLDVQPVRYYPNGSVAAHLMGYIRKKNSRDEDEDFSCQYYLPYYKGFSGLEYVYDDYLKGTPGVKWVLVNNASFRQREETKVLAGAGSNLFLTIDLRVQKAAEKAFEKAAHTIQDGIMEGAAVVMDVRNGDILAMASSPTYDPNLFASGITTAQNNYLQDKKLRPTVNRATEANYPGSVFKIITSIACLENGLDPNSQLTTHGEYRPPRGGRGIGDTVPGGRYAFDEAFYRSSNEYFCENGVQAGYRRIVDVGRRFHLGELTEIGFGLETRGTFPATDDSEYMKTVRDFLPYVCIGQQIKISPLQITCMITAIANGGTLYWPRITSHLQDPDTGQTEEISPPGRLRDKVQINPKHLDIIRHAMVLDTENPLGSAYPAFYSAPGVHRSSALANFRVGGKTGTAQSKDGGVKDDITWFASYGPWDNPRYAVVVMVQSGRSGGKTCAPIAAEIYEALVKIEQTPVPSNATANVAQN